MPFVLLRDDAVRCPHGGTVQTAGAAKLTVGGRPVLLLDGVSGHAVAGCLPPPNSTPCTLVGAASGGAARLTAGGHPVALQTLAASTDGKVAGVPQALLPTPPSQSRLSAG